MKKIMLLLLNVVLICMVTFFTSCSKNDDMAIPNSTPEEPIYTKPTTYTIMLYGSGGGNLDDDLNYNLSQISNYGKVSRINFTGLVKFSMNRQAEKDLEGTRLFTLTDEGMKNEKKYEASYRLDNPEHLSNFIKETKEKMPADKYILIFRNHGLEFGFTDKLVESEYPEFNTNTRSVLFDDNTATFMSTYEIEKAIKDSGTKLDLIYFDAGMMGMAEVFYQLKDCAKYIMTSSHYSFGGNYSQLLYDLQEKDSLVDALKDYVPATMRYVQNVNCDVSDLECYDMQYIEEFVQHVKTAADELIRLKREITEIPEGLPEYDERVMAKDDWFVKTQYDESYGGFIYQFDTNSYSIDLYSLLTRLANYYSNGKLLNAAMLLRKVLDRMTVANASVGLPNWLDRVSMGVTWPTPKFIDWPYEDYKEIIRHSAFCKTTGWDKILLETRNPVMSWIHSAFFDYYYFYEGELSIYKYDWKVYISVDESKVYEENLNGVRALVSSINQESDEAFSKAVYPLRHSEALAEDIGYKLDSYRLQFLQLGVDTVYIHVRLKDGESVDPNDDDAGKYPTTLDRVRKFDGANFL